MKKRKANLPLIEVLVGSLLFHIILGVILGGYVIATAFNKKPAEFEPPPEIKKIQPQKLQYKIQMQQQQQKSSTPRQQRIQVESPVDIALPEIDVSIPNISANVAVGTGAGGGSGSGSGLGSGGLSLGKFEFEFMGIRAAGEKIMILISAERLMMDDAKGSYPAFRLIKEEVARIVGNIPTGYLYNVGYFLWGSMGFANPSLSNANEETEKYVLEWSDPINKDFQTIMQIPDSRALMVDMGPLGKQAAVHWVGAIITAMEMSPDTIFMMVPRFRRPQIEWTEEDKQKAWREAGFDEEDLRKWRATMAEARRLLAQRNAERRQKGEVESMITAKEIATKELNGTQPPTPGLFSNDQILETVEIAIEKYYTSKKLEPPSINIVIFAEKDWEKTQPELRDSKELFSEVIRLGRGGRIKIIEALDGIKSAINRTR